MCFNHYIIASPTIHVLGIVLGIDCSCSHSNSFNPKHIPLRNTLVVYPFYKRGYRGTWILNLTPVQELRSGRTRQSAPELALVTNNLPLNS